jgi:hypothetical protein
MERFGGPGHIWQHMEKYSGNAKERIQQTIDFEAAETHIGRRNSTKFNYAKAGWGKLPWFHSWMCGTLRGTSGRKAVCLKPFSQNPRCHVF